MKKLIIATLIFSLIGLLDAGYLTWKHYAQVIPPCSTSVFVDCGKVLHSSYAVMLGVPVALLGVFYYAFMAKLAVIRLSSEKVQKWAFSWVIFHKLLPKRWQRHEDLYLEWQVIAATAGITFSAYFMYLQLIVIQSICLYCVLSAMNSAILFGLVIYQRFFYTE